MIEPVPVSVAVSVLAGSVTVTVVVPAAIIARACSSVRTPPEAFTANPAPATVRCMRAPEV